MKFYQENKVNPFASCLPLLAQLPVFFALFYMLQDDLRSTSAGRQPSVDSAAVRSTPAPQFLFIPDLTDKATGGVLVVLIVLYVGSQLLVELLMSATADKTQRMIFMALPFIFVPFIINFPAGLLVYWITTNLWTVVQQRVSASGSGRSTATRRRASGRPGPGRACGRAEDRRRDADGEKGRRAPRQPRAVGGSRAQGPARAGRRRRRRARRRSAPGGAGERRPRDRVRDLLERVVEALGAARPTVEVAEEGESIIRASLRRRRSGAVHRPPRRDDRRRPAPRVRPRRATAASAGCASSSTRRATATAASGAAAPGRRGRGRGRAFRPPGRARRDDRQRAQARARVPASDRDDVETYSEGRSPTPPRGRAAA